MRLLAALVLLLWPALAHAQMQSSIVWDAPATQSFIGAGDIAPYTAFYSLRGYTAAVAATGTQKAVGVRRGSDNATTDIVILPSGNLDVATAAAFTSVDATGTGSISGTTLTFTGGHLGDVVTGAGVTPGTFIHSGSSPTWTINNSQTVGSETLTLTWGLFVNTIYDQTNNLSCGGLTCDMVQASANNQPLLLLTGCGGTGALPCIHGRVFGSHVDAVGSANNFTPNVGAQVSLSLVANRRTSGSSLFTDNGNNRFTVSLSNVWVLVFGGSFTASDEAWHAANGAIAAASIDVTLDGTVTTFTGAPADTSAGPPTMQVSTISGQGAMHAEMGFSDNVVWSAGTRLALCHNMRLYWGTGGSC